MSDGIGIKIKNGKPYFEDTKPRKTFTDRVVGQSIRTRDITHARTIDEVEDIKAKIRNRILWAVSLTAGVVQVIDVVRGWIF